MNTTTIQDQPAPTHNALTPVWDLVIQDMQERNQVGIQRYGTPLQPFNGRDALVDAYQEALDLAVYLRQAIVERTALDDLEQEHRMMRARNERLEAELAALIEQPAQPQQKPAYDPWRNATPSEQPAPVQKSCYCPNCEALSKELTELKAQPEQEPDVYIPADALRQLKGTSLLILRSVPLYGYRGDGLTPLYTTPPQRKPLTADDLKEPKNGQQWRVEWWNESCRMMLPSDANLDRFVAYKNGTLQFTIKKVDHGIKGDA